MMPGMLLNVSPRRPARPRRMTRCECSGVSFEELRGLMCSRGLAFGDACQQTGCGQTCTACLDDLGAFMVDSSEPAQEHPSGPWLRAEAEGA